MKDLFKYIAENIANGNIEKNTAIGMLSMLKGERVRTDDIAIIGISVLLPSADNLEDFWRQVRGGVDGIGPFPESRQADIDAYLRAAEPNKHGLSYSVGAYLDEIDKFDYEFFRLSPKEASLMDPNQRLFLQNVWHAIEDAGYGGQKLVGSNTGVFVGFVNGFRNYGKMVYDLEPQSLSIAMPGNFSALLPSRISYLLDLKGPSMILDTACSSSLVAVDSAIQAIRSKHCDVAIASGVRLQIVPVNEEELSIGLESSDGKTRAFDDTSDGAGIGEGIATVILKPLSKALKDNDQVYAVIKGSAVNQDGSSIGITAPNPAAQADVIAKAWENAGVDPETISYIVTHGTGTKLGDPIEIKGIQSAFRRYTNKRQFCAISSVKSNIGHLYESSGIVSLIKAVLALRHQELPPTIHFNRPNREIAFEESPVYVNTKLRRWETDGTPRRCGISSFGMSGTNCHVVLEEAPPRKADDAKQTGPHLLTLSARSEEALQELAGLYTALLQKEPDLPLHSLCYTANTGRGHYGYRAALLFETREEALLQLQALQEQGMAQQTAGLLTGWHKISAGARKSDAAEEITERERMERSDAAHRLLERWTSSASRDLQALGELCRAYISGADVDFEQLAPAGGHRKITVPGYPFRKNRCWLNLPAANDVQMHAEQEAYYRVEWTEQELPVQTGAAPGTVLVVHDPRGLAAATANHLQSAGWTVLDVTLGESFRQTGAHSFEVGPEEKDYHALLQALPSHRLTHILHAGVLPGEKEITTLEDLQASQQCGFYSLFYLTRALAAAGIKDEIDLLLLAQTVHEVTGREARFHPEGAPLFGLGRVVRVEHPKVNVRCLDLDAAATAEQVLAELLYGRAFLQAAYRQGRRYTGVFGSVDVRKLPERRPEIKRDGVYLITGGTGGIGLEMAKWLAAQQHVNLAFLSRTPMPDRLHWERLLIDGGDPKTLKKIKGVQELEATGSRVTLLTGDASDPDALRTAVGELQDRFGRINGVLHAAGVPGSGYITQKTAGQVSEVLHPKIEGTWLLQQALERETLDFFVLFSSGAALIGEPGQGDYAAANSFLDAFALSLAKRGTKALAINWTSWKEAGMSVEHGDNIDRLFKALPTKQAVALFERAMQKDLSRVFIGELNPDFPDLDSFLEQSPYRLTDELRAKLAGQEQTAQAGSVKRTVQLTGRGEEGYSELELTIADVWHEILGFAEFSIEDNFHELGGDSVIALRIANLLNKRLGVNLHASDLLKHLTIADLGRFLSEAAGGEEAYPPIIPVAKQDVYPLSSAQKRLYVLEQLAGQRDTAYNISKAVLLEGDLKLERFDSILQTIIGRHETLRTTIELVDGEPVQKIHDEVEFAIEVVEAQEAQIDEMIHSFFRPFDLKEPPQLRIRFLKLSEHKHLALFDMHHIITDGASMDILVEEIAELYRGGTLETLPVQYKDYAAWQHELLSSPAFARQKAYWQSVFETVPHTPLPTDFPRPEELSAAGAKHLFRADRELTAKINRLTQTTGTTLYMVLLAAYNVLLAKYSGSADVVVGSPIIGRPREELERIIGMFVNTVAIRNRPEGGRVFREFLQEVKANCLDGFKHQDYPFEQLVHDLGLRRDVSRNPLFDTMFALQNVGVRGLQIEHVTFSTYDFQTGVARFDLYLDTVERDGEIAFALEYRTQLFAPETIERMAQDYLSILEAVAEEPDRKLEDIELFSSRALQPAALDDEEIEIEFNF